MLYDFLAILFVPDPDTEQIRQRLCPLFEFLYQVQSFALPLPVLLFHVSVQEHGGLQLCFLLLNLLSLHYLCIVPLFLARFNSMFLQSPSLTLTISSCLTSNRYLTHSTRPSSTTSLRTRTFPCSLCFIQNIC